MNKFSPNVIDVCEHGTLFCNHNTSSAASSFIQPVDNFTPAQKNVTKLGNGDVKGNGEKNCKSQAVCRAEHAILVKKKDGLSEAVNMSK